MGYWGYSCKRKTSEIRERLQKRSIFTPCTFAITVEEKLHATGDMPNKKLLAKTATIEPQKGKHAPVKPAFGLIISKNDCNLGLFYVQSCLLLFEDKKL